MFKAEHMEISLYIYVSINVNKILMSAKTYAYTSLSTIFIISSGKRKYAIK